EDRVLIVEEGAEGHGLRGATPRRVLLEHAAPGWRREDLVVVAKEPDRVDLRMRAQLSRTADQCRIRRLAVGFLHCPREADEALDVADIERAEHERVPAADAFPRDDD